MRTRGETIGRGCMLRVDQVLHRRYRVVRQLGHGGMGAVYEAVDERFGGPIALKEIAFASSSVNQKELVAKAFEREAMALAKAQHEAIPYVRDFFTEDDRQFLVMELVAGDDLATMMARRYGPFPLSDCMKWLDQLLDALDYLHTLEPPIIHRDIKPQNLKLTRRGRVKLLDFGIAKSVDSGAHTLTGQTFVGATMDYSPVEQILRAIDPTFREYIMLRHRDKAERVLGQTTDARCDLFSLGATFYHLLTAQPPADAVKRMLESWEGRPDPLANPSTVNVAIPPAISSILLKAMAIDRDERFSSALEMQAALDGAVTQDKFLGEKVHNDPWSDRPPLNSSANDEERRLMRAETVRLDVGQPGGSGSEGGSAVAMAAVTAESLPSVSAQPASDGAVAARESSSADASDSMDWSDLAAELPSETPAVENRKTIAYEVRQATPAETVATRRPNIYWILPVTAAAGLFVITSIGGMIYLINGYLTQRRSSVQNVNRERTLSPTPTPSSSPTVEVLTTPSPTRTATPVRTPRPTPSATPSKTPVSTPLPTPLPTPEPTPRATPAKTPRPTPRPRPSKTPDPNCIYNNTCGY